MNDLAVISPLSGWLTRIDAVPDPVFAERMLGNGVAIDPIDGRVLAPLAGRIATLHSALHAVTIEGDAGPVLLIHVGLETVGLAGEGFVAHVGEGDHVAAGDVLLSFDLDAIGRRARSLVTPIVLTNEDRFELVSPKVDRLVEAGSPLFSCRPRAKTGVEKAGSRQGVERSLTIPLRHGIHARPAARIAAAAKGFDAAIELVASDGRSAPASSPVAVLALALPHGAHLRVRGTGHDAARACAAVSALIESGMGEAAPVEERTASPRIATEASHEPLPPILRGVTASPGLAIGVAWRFARSAPQVPAMGRGAAIERDALSAALDRVRIELVPLASGAGAQADIAEAHLAFLEDPELLRRATDAIEAGRSAGAGWQDAIETFVRPLLLAADARFAERIDDLRDLDARVLSALYGAPATPRPPAGAILVSNELLPSQLMALADGGLAGIATAGGGPTSHVAIIAAGLGLPMIAALGGDLARVADGTSLLLDASAGTLAIDATAERIAAARSEAERARAFRAAADARAHEPALTSDGVRIEVFANLGSLDEARSALIAGAEGCGLLRTEFLFLDRDTPPGEEEQHAAYQAIADALNGRPLVVRTLDIGADKPAPYLPLAAEDNPALGLRGVRVGLAMPDLLATQLRALARVTGDVRIMLPMVIEPGEVTQARAMLEAVVQAAGQGSAPELGIMVETPAAAMLAGALAREAAFFSIGSNDLSQYALAMDRGNPAVAGRLDALHPAVLRLIEATVAGGRTASRWTGVCGGMAADPLAVSILIGLGVTELSVPVAAIAATKAHVRRHSRADCRALAERALALGDAAAVRALAGHFVGEGGAP